MAGILQADVCIVCALEEEADAVEQEVCEHCETAFAAGTTNDGRFVYRYTTITNNKHEQLTLLLLRQTRPGPVFIALDLRPLLQMFQPRFVAMSGICAGDKRHVQLGDLVVAEYAYHFEEGKATRDQQGAQAHEPEGITYGPAERVLQYIRTFDTWKAPVLELKKRFFNNEEPPRRIMALMASGMAVRSDDPFESLQKQHRKTWALDMEAATFYLALRAFPGIDGLVVKGVVDYADLSKDDAFHDFAAHASALYLLTFIQEYVTENMPFPPKRRVRIAQRDWGEAPSAIDQSNHKVLFNILQKRYKDELDIRCSGKNFISLELHELFDFTYPRSSHSSQRSKHHEQALPEGTTIAEVYNQLTRGLLILGKPGAGKTTLLYYLAIHLLKEAESDESRVFPMILNLSSWAKEQLPLSDWVVKELEVSYDIPRKLGQQWLREGRFQLLLDGFDEVPSQARSACINAINTYHQERLIPFAIGSREEEFVSWDTPAKLAVQSTLIIQSPTSVQVDAYLADPSLVAIQEGVRTSSTFRDLLKTPLMLNTTVLSYQDEVFEGLPKGSTVAALQQQVFFYHLQQGLKKIRKPNFKTYSTQRVQSWLQWLARQMQHHNQSMFYLEHLQYDWLPEEGQRRLYVWLGVRLPGILIGFLLACLINRFFFHDAIADLLVHSIPGAIVGGLLSTRYISQSSSSQFQQKKFFPVLKSATLLGGAYAVVLILIDLSTNSPYSFWGGVIFGTWSFLLTILLSARQSSFQRDHFSIPKRLCREKGRRNDMLTINPWRDSLLVGLLTGLSWGFIRTLTDGLREGISAAMSFALVYTLSGILLSALLVEQAIEVSPTEMIDPSLGKFWRSLMNRNHFKTILLIGSGTCVLFGLSYALSYGLRFGVSYGFIYAGTFGVTYALGSAANYWFLVGLFQGISRDTMPNEEPSSISNDKIRHSARNGLYLGLIGGIVSACIASITTMLSNWLIYLSIYTLLAKKLGNPLIDIIDGGAVTWVVTFLTVGIVIGLVKGGIAWWRHWILRFLLSADGIIPWHYRHFLENACRYHLLRKEGREGYRFFHDVFRDYLASLPTHED